VYYLVVDGEISGTGIRDAVTGGSLEPSDLGLSRDLQIKISAWVSRYEEARYGDYKDVSEVEYLDGIGLELALQVKDELPGSKIRYQSDATMKLVGVPFL
jgi:hypothetical protein